MEIVLFKIRTRDDIDVAEYNATFESMLALVSEIPGFVDIAGYAGEDGSELAVARFENPQAIAEWRDQPQHAATRERGRAEFFESYDITIATVNRQYDWHR
jgi:heme-degrading monooxygenase HmoA